MIENDRKIKGKSEPCYICQKVIYYDFYFTLILHMLYTSKSAHLGDLYILFHANCGSPIKVTKWHTLKNEHTSYILFFTLIVSILLR